MAALTLFLALLLAVSAMHKVTARDRLAPVAARLTGLPPALGLAALLGAAAVEALAALALLVPALRLVGAAIACALWAIYALALLRHRGAVLDCGCDFIRREKPVGAAAIVRPAGLAVLACAVGVLPAGPFTPDAPFAALALLALWFAAAELSALPSSVRTRS